MSFVRGLIKVATGAGAGIAVVTALPVFGAIGAITATGLVIGSILGAAAGVADTVLETKHDNANRAGVQRKVKRRDRSS
jgi:hypothetical protein